MLYPALRHIKKKNLKKLSEMKLMKKIDKDKSCTVLPITIWTGENVTKQREPINSD